MRPIRHCPILANALCILLFTNLGMNVKAAAQSTDVTIQGKVQFWERTCSATARCGLPVQRGQTSQVSGRLLAPEQVGSVSSWKASYFSENLEAKTAVYWRKTNTPPFQYLVQQTKLFVDGRAVGECSTYQGVPDRPFVGVGACSVFMENGQKQIGVSFYR